MTGTIVEVTIPSEQFALAYTLAELESVTFEVEQIAATSYESVMPFIQAHSSDRAPLETAFTNDESVAGFQLIGEFDTECLYQVKWDDHITQRVNSLVRHEGSVLRAIAHDERWEFRLLFAEREMASRTYEYCQEHGIDFTVAEIRDFTNQSARAGLTDCQQTALKRAAERGYYAVPREVTADELAAEFGITHQALSERLRRAHGSLVQHVFGTRESESAESPPAVLHRETSAD